MRLGLISNRIWNLETPVIGIIRSLRESTLNIAMHAEVQAGIFTSKHWDILSVFLQLNLFLNHD